MGGIVNKKLAEQIFQIAVWQGYDCTFHTWKTFDNYTVYLKANSTNKFYKEVIKPLPNYYKKDVAYRIVLRNLNKQKTKRFKSLTKEKICVINTKK